MTDSDPRIVELMELSPFDFEKEVTQLIIALGFRAQQTQPSRDGGIDIWAEDERPFGSGRIIIQCKRYASDNLVGEPVIRELFGLVHAHGVNKGILLTTSGFTADASRFAAGKPIELMDGMRLLAVLKFVGDLRLSRNIQTTTPSLLTFSDVSATMREVLDWSTRRPKPFALRIKRTLTEFWDFFWSNWGPNCDCTLPNLLFVLDYHAASYHLLEDATFRPEVSPPQTMLRLFEQRVAEITSLIGERMRAGDKAVLCEADEYLATYRSNRDDVLKLCQSDLQPLCVEFWWKPHKGTFMRP